MKTLIKGDNIICLPIWNLGLCLARDLIWCVPQRSMCWHLGPQYGGVEEMEPCRTGAKGKLGHETLPLWMFSCCLVGRGKSHGSGKSRLSCCHGRGRLAPSQLLTSLLTDVVLLHVAIFFPLLCCIEMWMPVPYLVDHPVTRNTTQINLLTL